MQYIKILGSAKSCTKVKWRWLKLKKAWEGIIKIEMEPVFTGVFRKEAL